MTRRHPNSSIPQHLNSRLHNLRRSINKLETIINESKLYFN